MLKNFSGNKNSISPFASNLEEKSLKELLKMSMVPLACQECKLSRNGSTISESIEWLLDLKDEIPIWSRLNEINTSGFKRKLPMSMTKNFDIEIKGRLWSLWGQQRKRKNPKSLSKSYMATTVMALCTARVISLNLWNTNLMDSIKRNGREYYKSSLKESCCCHKYFYLENLNSKCCLEGIEFKVNLKTFQKGRLYTQENLACGLQNFFTQYRFGILECGNHILGFGFIDGPRGGYFMYDAQSSSYPIFPKDVSAPYVLRTNHLQILLYCIIVALHISYKHADFCLHQVYVKLVETYLPKVDLNYCTNNYITSESSLSSHFWKTFSILPLKCKNFHQNISEYEKIPCIAKSFKNLKNGRKYRRKIHNITKEEVERSLIKPFVDADRKSHEDLQVNKDFVRIICSQTEVHPIPAIDTKNLEKDFVCNLVDALVMGPQ